MATKHLSPRAQVLLLSSSIAFGSISLIAYCCYCSSLRSLTCLVEDLEKKRQEERTGRIRAEVRLREALKQTDKSRTSPNGQYGMLLQRIGTVTSPYTKRMGTPRQPQLVPASRGWIDLHPPLQPALLDGIQHYSHVWVIFEFHANTDTAAANKKTKIRPPRANGLRVGQLATRSPHRPNPIGLSLVSVEKWEKRRLHVSGLDLVNGTPVYDIKPFVPWDIPGSKQVNVPSLRVPNWVDHDDTIANVEFSASFLTQLQQVVTAGHLKPLYHDGNGGFEGTLETLRQILAQDPRSSHRGVTKNARGMASTNRTPYRIVFGGTQVTFYVGDSMVHVASVAPVDFDPDCYSDGIPLVLSNNAK